MDASDVSGYILSALIGLLLFFQLFQGLLWRHLLPGSEAVVENENGSHSDENDLTSKERASNVISMESVQNSMKMINEKTDGMKEDLTEQFVCIPIPENSNGSNNTLIDDSQRWKHAIKIGLKKQKPKSEDTKETPDDTTWRCPCENGFLPPGIFKSFGSAEAMFRMGTGQYYHKR